MDAIIKIVFHLREDTAFFLVSSNTFSIRAGSRASAKTLARVFSFPQIKLQNGIKCP
jgi:hypothetical protein